jgi:hypothetical protein
VVVAARWFALPILLRLALLPRWLQGQSGSLPKAWLEFVQAGWE